MGGQACILYGAAEFSRDVDMAVLADERNLDRLQRALAELQAEAVYFPSLSKAALQRGHACHFRARIPGADDVRLDVMSVLHGCEEFHRLWQRRRRLKLPWALKERLIKVDEELRVEQDALRAADRAYWQPLREELFRWRQDHHRR